MATSVQSIPAAAPSAPVQTHPVSGVAKAPSASAGGAPDRVALQANPMPALLLGAAAAAQLVPGVVEAEGATGAATAIGTGLRAALANPGAKAIVAAGAGAAGGYARSLLHDATAGQAAFKAAAHFGHALDASVHSALGIPQSDAR